MSSNKILSLFTNLYILFFLGYMLLPLGIMAVAAFNAHSIPTVVPWKGGTLQWFSVLFGDGILWEAVMNSLLIGTGVIALAIPIGLAGAILLTGLSGRARTLLYAVLVSPILTPGVIIGISTLVLWNTFGVSGGLFLSVIGQTTFVASFCMLLFMARLQRFDRAQEEAALDLGASRSQVFFRITLPFLRPTLLSAVGIAFLQSFENYNTTLFVIGAKNTMTIRISSMVRLGLTPEVNALALIFIAFTLVAAVAFTLRRRAEKRPSKKRPGPRKQPVSKPEPQSCQTISVRPHAISTAENGVQPSPGTAIA